MSRSFLARGEEEGPATAGGEASRGAQQTLYGTLRTGDRQRRYLPRGRITPTFGSVGSQPALLTERHTRAHDTRVPNDAKQTQRCWITFEALKSFFRRSSFTPKQGQTLWHLNYFWLLSRAASATPVLLQLSCASVTTSFFIAGHLITLPKLALTKYTLCTWIGWIAGLVLAVVGQFHYSTVTPEPTGMKMWARKDLLFLHWY